MSTFGNEELDDCQKSIHILIGFGVGTKESWEEEGPYSKKHKADYKTALLACHPDKHASGNIEKATQEFRKLHRAYSAVKKLYGKEGKKKSAMSIQEWVTKYNRRVEVKRLHRQMPISRRVLIKDMIGHTNKPSNSQ